MIPTNPDWQAIATELRLRWGTDLEVVRHIARQGVVADQHAIQRLRNGVARQPKDFPVAAALLNLMEIERPHRRVRRRNPRLGQRRQPESSRPGVDT